MEKEHIPYSILLCPDGDVMLLIASQGDRPKNALLIYDGRDMAILLRGDARTVRLRDIQPEVAKLLSQASVVFVAEHDGKTVVNDYYVKVRMVRDLKRLIEGPF